MDTATRLSNAFLQAHPDDAARILEGFGGEQCAGILAGCESIIAAGVVRRMTSNTAAGCLTCMPPDKSGPIVADLPIHVAALIVRQWAPDMQTRILETLPSQTADAMRRILNYPPGTVGALMDPLAFVLPTDITVAEARQRLEDAAEKVLYYLYIVDREQRLVGVLNLREFILASAKDQLSAIMHKQVTKLKAAMPLEHLANHPDGRRFLSFPVVDGKDIFLGVLSSQALFAADGLADPGRARQTSLDTIVAFGELYWVTLSGMLSGVNPPKKDGATDQNPSTELPDAH